MKQSLDRSPTVLFVETVASLVSSSCLPSSHVPWGHKGAAVASPSSCCLRRLALGVSRSYHRPYVRAPSGPLTAIPREGLSWGVR